MTQYVYAGVPQWSAVEGSEPLGGLYRQEVGGREWSHLSNGLPDKAAVRTVAIHPQNPQLIYVGTQYGPYRSADGGENWERLLVSDVGPDGELVVWSIIFHPHNPQTLYMGTAPTAVYRSDDGGQSWRRLPIIVPSGMVTMAFPARVISMTIDPSNPDEIYAGLEVGGVIRSLDGGETWSDCTQALLALAEQGHLKSQLGSDTEVEGMMDSHAISVSAAQPGMVFLATRMGLFCSPDRGKSWREMEIWRHSPFAYGRDIKVAPHDPNTLYAALSPAAISKTGAIYRSQDLGQTWHRFDHSVTPRRTMMALATSRQDPQCVYGLNSIGQVFGTQDGGETWNDFSLPVGVRNVYALACS